MSKLKIGIIGCGSIGSHLARAVAREFKKEAVLCYLCDHRLEKAERIARQIGKSVTIVDLETLITRSDLIIEAASAKISGEVASRALSSGKQVLIMSVGGLIGKKIQPISKVKGRLWIPSGALAGIDALLAANEGRIRSVRLITRKPPEALRKAVYFSTRKFPALRGNKERRVFKGSALEAVAAFPENINVAAVLSLAGIGPRKTQIEIWTSRDYLRNRHEVRVAGDFGSMTTVTENVPFPHNPKTSFLAALSATATLKKIFSSVRIGT